MKRTIRARWRWLIFAIPAVLGLYSVARATNGIGSDVVANLRTDSTALLTIEGTTTPVHLVRGSAMIQNLTPNCVASAGHPCNASVNWFLAAFEPATVTISVGPALCPSTSRCP